MIRTQILLTPALYETLKHQASMEGKSLSAIIRDSLTQMMTKKKKTKGHILQKMAKHAVSSPKTPRDLSSNDDYIYKLP
jgi:hypothetical protein